MILDEPEAGNSKTGLAAWLLSRLRREAHRPPRLALVERINLAPKQSLALVEAEGRRFLIATSTEGAPAFFALDDTRQTPSRTRTSAPVAARVSW